MKNRIIRELATIASEKYQDRYIRRATKDEYVLPEEMIDTALGTINTIMTNPALSKSLSNLQIDALKRFGEVAAWVYAKLPWNSTKTAADILETAEWEKLRSAAVECLRQFSVDLDDWEATMK